MLKRKEMEEYDVRGKDNKLFCKCVRREGGAWLIGADGHTIELNSLIAQVYNPVERGRPKKRLRTPQQKEG